MKLRFIRRGARLTKHNAVAFLTFMSRIMQHQHESMHTIYDIVMNLKEMFGDQDHDDRQDGIKVFHNTKMTKGIPYRISF